MSKKVIMLSVAVLFGMQAGLAMAANPDTGPGCGLGKLAWADYTHQKEYRAASLDGHDQRYVRHARHLGSAPGHQAARTMGR